MRSVRGTPDRSSFAIVIPLLVLALSGLAAPPAAPAQERPPDLDRIDAFIEAQMREWRVPGLAIAVVRDGDVILSEGYGRRDVEEGLPVTPATLFAIGSITKSMTVTALGTLADSGEVAWDEPVRTYLPAFRLHDEVASERLTVRDLVTHRSGLPRHDLLWYGSGLSREELFRRLRHLEPSGDIRSRFQYQNLMFMTAGMLAGEVAGGSWEALVRERIFEPLGMARSNFSVDRMAGSSNAARPYLEADDSLVRVPYRKIDEIGPAGSVNSSVEEMIRYVRMHLGKGALVENGDTARVLSEATATAMHEPRMVIPGTPEDAELGHEAYGMGLFVTTYRGKELVHHGGGIDGFISLLSFMPREGLGMIVLTNMSGTNPVPTLVTRRIYDLLLDLEPVDWPGRVAEDVREADERRAEREAEEAEETVEGTSPSHSFGAYAGRYRHPGYGTVEIRRTDDGLRLLFHGEAAPLEHRHYDVFHTPDDPLLMELGDVEVQFFYDRDGTIDRLAIPLEPRVADIVFEKVEEDGGGDG